MKIIRCEHGTAEEVVDVAAIRVPDLWHLAMSLMDEGREAEKEMVLECWHMAHDMRGALQSIGGGADITKPVHTKDA